MSKLFQGNFKMTLNPLLKHTTPVHLQERTTEEFHLWEVGAIKLVPLVTADPENLQLQKLLLDLLKR